MFIFLSDAKAPQGFRVFEQGDVSMRSSGLRIESPGDYVSGINSDEEATIQHGAIRYFYGQTHASLIYWNTRKQTLEWLLIAE